MHTTPDFMKFVSLIRDAQTTTDVLNAWDVLHHPYNDLRVIVALPDYSKRIVLPGVNIRDLSGQKIITPYFSNDSLHFSSRQTIKQTIKDGEIKIPLDGSIMLDTNIASYISAYINRRSFGNNQAEIVNLIHQLIEKNPNYDYIYYLTENSKKFIDKYGSTYKPNADELWSDIDDGFKDNLISLRQFFSINSQRFKASNNDQPTLSRTEAEKEAKEFTHNFYFSRVGTEIFEDTKRRFLISRIILYKMISINFGSNEGFKKKSIKFLQFMIEKLDTYFDREMHVAIKYFKEGKKFSFFKKIDKGKHISLNSVRDKIENMAWDLMIPRFIESISSTIGNGKYFIPHYLTWDDGLKESLNIYKAKACFYDDALGRVVTIPEFNIEKTLRDTVGDYYVEQYFDSNIASLRHKAKPLSDIRLGELLNEVESELFAVIHA